MSQGYVILNRAHLIYFFKAFVHRCAWLQSAVLSIMYAPHARIPSGNNQDAINLHTVVAPGHQSARFESIDLSLSDSLIRQSTRSSTSPPETVIRCPTLYVVSPDFAMYLSSTIPSL